MSANYSDKDKWSIQYTKSHTLLQKYETSLAPLPCKGEIKTKKIMKAEIFPVPRSRIIALKILTLSPKYLEGGIPCEYCMEWVRNSEQCLILG